MTTEPLTAVDLPRRPSGTQQTPQRVTLALWLIVGLLVLTSLLLWRLLEQKREPVQVRGDAQALPQAPPLPAPTRTSSNAVLQQLDETTRRFTDPVGRMEAQLAAAVGDLSFTRSLPSLLSGISTNTRALTGVPADMQQLVAEAHRLDAVRESLVTIMGELRSFRNLQPQLTRLNGSVQLVHGDLRSAVSYVKDVRDIAVSTFPQMLTTLSSAAHDVARIRQCAERAFVCPATSSNSAGSGTSILPRQAPGKEKP